MAKNRNREQGAAEAAADQPQVNGGTEPTPSVDPNAGTVPAGPNFVLTYRRNHPGNRCSYGIAGNAGIVVFDIGLFAGSTQPGFTPPPTITLDCEMVPVKQDNKTAKAEAAAAKLVERAKKAQEKIEAAQKKAEDKKRKAEEQLAAARAKVEAAQKAAETKSSDAPAS